MQSFITTVTINQQPIKIYGLLCGKVALKKAALATKSPGQLGTLLTFWKKEWDDWMPIWAWVIEHPEGVFLIDTGEIVEVTNPAYYASLPFLMKYYCTTQMRFQVDKSEEIDQQLKQVGLRVDRIDQIFLTHLHLDHADGIKFFPKTPILVNEYEWTKQHGTFPQFWPEWFAPQKIALTQTFKNFKKAKSLTKANDLWMVETPGHTFGHSSIFLETDNGLICFAGDASYNKQQIEDGTFSATIASKKLGQQTYDQIKELSKSEKLIYLPSHDWESKERLMRLKGIEL